MVELREAFNLRYKLEIRQGKYDDRGGVLYIELKLDYVTFTL